MIAAIVAPAGVRSIAMMRACLVLGRVGDLDAGSTDCSRDLGLLAFRAGKRAAAFGLDLGLVMGSSEVHAAPSAAPPQPRLGKTPGRARIPRRAPVAPSHHSNAPIRQESQSILSKIVALMPRQLTSDSRQNPSAADWIGFQTSAPSSATIGASCPATLLSQREDRGRALLFGSCVSSTTPPMPYFSTHPKPCLSSISLGAVAVGPPRDVCLDRCNFGFATRAARCADR